MSTYWSSNGALSINTEDYEDVTCNVDDYSSMSNDQTNNAIDWYFPVIDLSEVDQWLLFENYVSLNELNVSEVCNVFKNKLLCEFHTEIFLQHTFIVQKLIRWLNENKETDLILECLNLLIDKVFKRHYECINGLCENFESIEQEIGCSNSQIISATNSDATSDEFLQWGIAKLCVSLMLTVLKHFSCNREGSFTLFMSSIHLLSSISDDCNIKFYTELVFSNYSVKHILLNGPLSSLKLLIVAKELSTLSGSLNEPFKGIITNILKEPYWIHLYPTLYHQLYVKCINEDLLELKIIKMVEDACTLSTNNNLNLKQYTELLSNSLPIIWFHQKFNIIDTFIAETCKHAKSSDIKNEYSNILLNLISFKSENVVLYTYLAINKIVKKLLNNFSSKPKHVENLIKNLLRTNVLNEILCFGCVHSNEQINRLASEIIEWLLKSKNTLTNDLWICVLSNLNPVFPILHCYSDKSSSFGEMVSNLFNPDQAEKFNISKLALLQSMILMLMSKDKKSRVEANYRITWLLQTTLNKSIDLPSDLFLIEYDGIDEQLEEPVGIYTENDLNGMIDLISDECSSHQTIKCALYKISVMLEHIHLQQYFIQNGGMNIILNLLKTSKLFVNERGLLIALLKLILCFTKKKKKLLIDSLLANNYEIQLQLISVLSDFYEIPLVKQYILQIFVYCIFDQYLIHFGELPKVIVDKVLYSQIKIKEYWNPNNNRDDHNMLFLNIKNNKSCMDVLILTWHLKNFNNIDSFLENGFTTNAQNYSFNEVFQNIRKASIKWSVKNYLIDLSSAKSHSVALAVLGDLKRYFELSVYIEQFEVDKELLEKALKKFLILPPILSNDLQTLIIVLKLLNFTLKKRVLINQFYWVADVLKKSEVMHHSIRDNFKNDERSTQLCNQFYFELYEVYWLCLKNFNHFSTISLTKLLFEQFSTTKNELVLLQANLKCITILTENPKIIDYELVQMYLSQLISLQTVLMNDSNVKSLQPSYLTILNHILHHTVLEPKICEVWSIYDWEIWTWSMIHSTDPLVRALVFQFLSGLAVIDVPMSHNLIHLALNYFCESNCVKNCIVAEQASIFCSNIFCNPKFKSLCHQYIIKLDLNGFVNIINMCSSYDCDKPGKKYVSTSPKLVANICCLLFNMITLTEIDLYGFDQNCHFVHALAMCLKKYLTPISIEKPIILEMCGRICFVLSLFVPVNNYNFENVLTYLNVIFDRIVIDLDHCTTMVWKSVFQLIFKVIQFTNNKLFKISNNLVLVLLKSVTSKNNDLCIDALNVISVSYSQLSEKLANHVCNILTSILHSEWNHKLKRKMLLVSLSNILFEHPYAYEIAKQGNLLCFLISKLKSMQLQISKQLNQKSKTLQNEYLEIVGFFCNVFNGCVRARKDASAKLPDIIHKLWSIFVTNPKSELLICTLQMLISLTSNCPKACSAMTMTSSTVGVDPKTKSTSYSLFHEIIALFSDFHLSGDVLDITLILILNCCQAQECRVIITKSKLLSNIVSIFNVKDKKCSVKIEQKCLNFLLVYTSFHEGQINLLKVDYVLDTLIDLLKSNYKNDSTAILRNLCFNVQNRVILLSSDIFLNGIKTLLEKGNLSNQQYRDISLAIWSVACNNQKARFQLRHWGIDKYFEKSSSVLECDDETQNVMNCTYQVLKN